MPKRALITGITGQDGAYLAELLIGKGYEVHGLKRRSSSFNSARIDHLIDDPHNPDLRLRLHYGDMTAAGEQVIATYHHHPIEGGVPLDITDTELLAERIPAMRPDAVIWLAGSKDVGRLEREPAFSEAINETPIRRLLDILHTMPVAPRLIYLSTDYVYCGRHGGTTRTTLSKK